MFERGENYISGPWKRGLDLSVSALASTLTAPIVGVLALAKYIEDGEPPFFVQERIGKNGAVLKIIKIRSMRSGEGPDEERVTELGKILRKTHLDELPQFWLVFRGEMSIVGRRPVQESKLVRTVNKVSFTRYEDIIKGYLEAESGLTGVWQIIGSGTENDHKIYHPNKFYSRNANLLLDLKIIYRTAKKVLKSLK